jgi:hypothetical protein
MKKPQWRIDLEAEAEKLSPAERPAFIAGGLWLQARLSEKGGQRGGAARARKLSAERRSEIAREGARKRWGNRT